MPVLALFAQSEEGRLAAAGLSPMGVLVGSLIMFGLVAVSLSRTWLHPRFSDSPDSSPTAFGDDDGTDAGIAVLIGRVVTVSLLALVVIIGFTGNPTIGANPVPIAVFSTFWFGGMLLALVAGGIWVAVHPIAALVAIVGRGRSRGPGDGDTGGAPDPTWWVPAVLLAGFAVLWICWPGGQRPRPAAGYFVVWSSVLAVGGLVRGPGWVWRHDPFSLFFAAVGACSPVRWTAAGPRLGSPVRHLAARSGDRATAAVLAVALGATVFDALRVTGGWFDLVGPRSLTSLGVLNTLAMVWVILVVAASWMAAAGATTRLAEGRGTADAEDDGAGARLALMMSPVLAAVVAGNRLGHELDRFLVATQHLISLVSDPFANGSDLFGTADWTDQQLISPATSAWLALLVILMGHLAALVVVHDRSVTRFGGVVASRAAWPFTVWLAVSLAIALRWMLG